MEFLGCKIELSLDSYFSTKNHFLLLYYSNDYKNFTFTIGPALIEAKKF